MANKDPIVRLDGARPANTYILSCLLGKIPAQPCNLQTHKNTFSSFKKLGVKIAESHNRTQFGDNTI